MKRLFSILIVLVAALPAWGQVNGVLILSGGDGASSLIDGTFIASDNSASPTTVAKLTLTTDDPACLGLGMGRSILKSDGTEPANDTFLDNDNWLTGGIAYGAVEHRTIDGNRPVPAFCWNNAGEQAESPSTLGGYQTNGVGINTGIQNVHYVEVKNWRGHGVHCAGSAFAGPQFWDYSHLWIHSCWTGISFGNSDTSAHFGWMVNIRDYGAWFQSGAGNCQLDFFHIFSTRCAVFDEGGGSRVKNCTLADSGFGYYGKGTYAKVEGCKMQHNVVRCAVLKGAHTSLIGCQIDVQRPAVNSLNNDVDSTTFTGCAGIDVRAPGCDIDSSSKILLDSFINGASEAGEGASTAVLLNGDADGYHHRAPVYDDDGLSGSKGFVIDVGVGETLDGIDIDCPMTIGYAHADDRLFTLNAARIRKARIRLLVQPAVVVDAATPPCAAIDLPADWGDNGSTFTLIDASGANADLELDGNTAY